MSSISLDSDDEIYVTSSVPATTSKGLSSHHVRRSTGISSNNYTNEQLKNMLLLHDPKIRLVSHLSYSIIYYFVHLFSKSTTIAATQRHRSKSACPGTAWRCGRRSFWPRPCHG